MCLSQVYWLRLENRSEAGILLSEEKLQGCFPVLVLLPRNLGVRYILHVLHLASFQVNGYACG